MKNRLAHLDLMRGLAALMVCAGHLRAFLLVDSARVQAASLIDKALYFLTGLGHQAVVVFFVLSGFFVGGGVVKAFSQNKWSWRQYAIRRLSRLWIVLLPALFLTLAFDLAGHHLAPDGYNGVHHDLYHSGPALDAPADWRFSTFLGNCFFVQTIFVPSFGTNGPLWSLANEFWYYLLFPLFLGALRLPKWPGKIISLFLAALLVIWLPKNILFSGLIWLFGVAVYLAGQKAWFKQYGGRPVFLMVTGLVALGSLALTKTATVLGSDYVVGIAFALFIAGLSVRKCESSAYAALATLMGETTYTLYLVHFPFLAFVFFTLFNGQKIQPNLMGCLCFLGLLAAALVYTTLVWWCFERNTDQIRKQLEARLIKPVVF
jgi:peptidoglycan/LPS O-acetylase OafA/YrhL